MSSRQRGHVFRAFSSSESEAVLLEQLLEGLDGDAADQGGDATGRIRTVDSLHGLVECSGLAKARLGDIVTLEGGFQAVVVSLERHAAKMAILASDTSSNATAAGAEVTLEVREGAAPHVDAQLLAGVSGLIVNPLGEAWPQVAGPSTDDAMRAVVHGAVKKWRHWPSDAPRRLSKREKFQTGAEAILPTGIPVLDALFPLRRGGSLVIAGPPGAASAKGSLACDIANNHVDVAYDRSREARMAHGGAGVGAGAGAGAARGRRCVYVSVGHSASATAKAAQAIGLSPAAGGASSTSDSVGARPISFVAAPAPDGLSAPLPMFVRALAPFVALEIAERGAAAGEDVMVIIDEVGTYMSGAMDTFDAVESSGGGGGGGSKQKDAPPTSAAGTGVQVRGATAAASAARSLCASFLDRTAVLRDGGGSISVVAVAHTTADSGSSVGVVDASASVVSEALVSFADATVPIRAQSAGAGRASEEGTLLVDWTEVAGTNSPSTVPLIIGSLPSSSPDGGRKIVGGAVGTLGSVLQALLRDSAEAKAAASLAKELGFLVEQEDPDRFDELLQADRALSLLSVASSTPSDNVMGERSTVSDYEAGVAVCLCALAEFGGADMGSAPSSATPTWSILASILRGDPKFLALAEDATEKIALLAASDQRAATRAAASLVERLTGVQNSEASDLQK